MVGWEVDVGKYSWQMCKINFDGANNANANSRYFDIITGYSDEPAWDIGAPSVKINKDQPWERTDEDGLNFTECPPLEKCVFQCASHRYIIPGNIAQQSTDALFMYGIYYGDTQLSYGATTLEGYIPPYGGAQGLTGASLAALGLVILSLMTF